MSTNNSQSQQSFKLLQILTVICSQLSLHISVNWSPILLSRDTNVIDEEMKI